MNKTMHAVLAGAVAIFLGCSPAVLAQIPFIAGGGTLTPPLAIASISRSGGGAAPCDVAASAGTPCVVAYSLERPLFSAYGGYLFEVQRASDHATRNIGIAGGHADTDTLSSFCAGTTCSFIRVYDQTSYHMDALSTDAAASAMPERPPLVETMHLGNGLVVPYFGAGYMQAGTRAGQANNGAMPTGSKPVTEYLLTNGNIVSNGTCCYDFGEAEAGIRDDGKGTMFAVWPTLSGYRSAVDLEDGIARANEPAAATNILTSVAKTDGTATLTMKYAATGNGLAYDTAQRSLGCGSGFAISAVPLSCFGYGPMRLEGGLTIGVGGDGSGWGLLSPSGGATAGAFIEGIVLAGRATDATDNAYQASVNQSYVLLQQRLEQAVRPRIRGGWRARRSRLRAPAPAGGRSARSDRPASRRAGRSRRRETGAGHRPYTAGSR
jgi:hypothetical protein